MAFTSAQKNAAAATAFAAMGNSGGGGLKKVSGNLPATYMNEFGATATRGSTDKKAKVVGRNKTENLAYPLSVEGDPGQGHYIIFEIMQQTKAKLAGQKIIKEAKDVVKNVAAQAGVSSENAVQGSGPLDKQRGSTRGSANNYKAQPGKKQSGPNSLQVAQDATKAMPVCIALYMPPSVQVNYGTKWNEQEIGVMAESVNAGIKAFMNTGGGLKNQLKAVGGEAWEGLKAGGAEMAKAAAPQGSAAVFAINTGSIITPRMELMFEGILRRTFSFNFSFIPKSEQEAEIVEQIVYKFKYHMSSNYGGLGMGGADGVREMEIPDFFNIRYMFAGQGGDIGPKKENMHLNLIKQCVLTSAGVEYGADRYKSYAGGRPQTTKLSLNFQELEIITKDYIEQGY